MCFTEQPFKRASGGVTEFHRKGRVGGGGLGYDYFLNRAVPGISEQGGIVEHTFIKQTFLFTKEKFTIYRRATW